MRGVIVVNQKSGPSACDPDELRRKFPSFDLEVVAPDDLDRVLGQTCSRDDLDVVGIAGGDGTMSAAAQLLAGGDRALLVIPGGTRNHFATDLGLVDVDAAAEAAAAGHRRRVDTGTVADRRFINNASIGWYPAMVRRREEAERRLPKAIAHPIAVAQQVRRAGCLDVEIDGSHHRVLAVFVGNGCYGDGLADLAQREALDTGELDVWTIRGGVRFARLRLFGAVLTGRLTRSPLVERRRTSRITIDIGHAGPVDIGLDGEVHHLENPLTFESDPGSLLVIAEPG